MRLITHKEINKSKWDSLVNESFISSLYLNSWYLDAACPSWDALVWDDYQAAIPLPTKRFFLFKKIYQPYFVQQTGLMSMPDFEIQKAFYDLENWKTYFYIAIQIQFNTHTIFPSDFNVKQKWNLVSKKNYALKLNEEYVILKKHYNENRRRNIKKAISLGYTVQTSTDIEPAIEMYTQNQAPKQNGLKKVVYEVLRRIFATCAEQNLAQLLTCSNSENETVSYALFVKWHNRIYYLFGTMNEVGRQCSAISLLFDHVIQCNATKPLTLDFEGGNLESIGNYFASFGAQLDEYISLSK